MPSVRKYLKQTVTVKRYVGFNDQSEPVYGEPEVARARKTEAFGRTVNELGVEVPNRTTLLTEVEVSVGDLIDDAPVEGVEEKRKKNGRLSHYEVQL